MTDKPKKKLPLRRKSTRKIFKSSNDEEEIVLNDTDEESDMQELQLCKYNCDMQELKYNCVGCGENFYQKQLIEDWIQCAICFPWVHENSTEFDTMCSKCDRYKKREMAQKQC